MKRVKNLIFVSLLCVALVMLFGLIGCNTSPSSSTNPPIKDVTDGNLTFGEMSDGTSYWVKASSTNISGDLVVPSTYNGKSVVRMGDYAFYQCSGLTSIAIPDSVTLIGWAAFYGCNALKTITFEGTTEQWQQITKGTGVIPSSATVYCLGD